MKLKHRLTTVPVSAYPMHEGQCIFDTDTSYVGIRAVLSQKPSNVRRRSRTVC